MAVKFTIVSAVITTFLHFGQSVDDFSYIGCFQDATTDQGRALPDYGAYLPTITIGSCRNLCAKQEFVYFGVEYDICFCGGLDADYSKHGQLDESSCDTQCRGNPTQACGDRNAIRVFVENIPGCEDIYLEHGQAHRIGLHVTFSCIKGYHLQGHTQVNCIYDDHLKRYRWNGTTPSCTDNTAPRTTRATTVAKRATTTEFQTTQTTTKEPTKHPTTLQSRFPYPLTLFLVPTKTFTTIKLQKTVATDKIQKQTTRQKEEWETKAKNNVYISQRATKAKEDTKTRAGNSTGTKSTSHYPLILLIISTIVLIMGVM